MRTNIEIDDQLMATAQRVSKIKTKKMVVEKALQMYIALENQKKIVDFWGKVELDQEAYK